MKYMVGYQLQEGSAWMDEIIRQREHIHEVYFAWGSMASGRGETQAHAAMLPHEALARQQADLERLKDSGVGLNLLLNANCYGRDSLSRAFLSQTGDLLDWLIDTYGVSSVTTTSPVLAHFIHRNFEGTEVRASVNMEVGTIPAMEYLADDFDGFYYKRELNRDLAQVRRLHRWCEAHGKKLYMLANSGCLNFCPARQFHDNLVAHEQEIARMDNAVQFHSACSQFLKKERASVLARLNCVRPEEMSLFEPYATAAKLATRVSHRPERILRAYVNGRHAGNLLDLLEPNHAAHFHPAIIDNTRLPADFCEHVSACSKDCEACGYCAQAYENACVTLNEGGILSC